MEAKPVDNSQLPVYMCSRRIRLLWQFQSVSLISSFGKDFLVQQAAHAYFNLELIVDMFNSWADIDEIASNFLK